MSATFDDALFPEDTGLLEGDDLTGPWIEMPFEDQARRHAMTLQDTFGGVDPLWVVRFLLGPWDPDPRTIDRVRHWISPVVPVIYTPQEGQAALARAIAERDRRGRYVMTPESAGLMPSYSTTLEEIVGRDTTPGRMTNHLALIPTSAKNWALTYQARFGGVDPAWVAAQIFRSPTHGAILQQATDDDPTVRVPLQEHVQLVRDILELSDVRLYDAAEGRQALQAALRDQEEDAVTNDPDEDTDDELASPSESVFDVPDQPSEGEWSSNAAVMEDLVDPDIGFAHVLLVERGDLQAEVLKEDLTTEQLYLLSQPAEFNPLRREIRPADLGLNPDQWPVERLEALRRIGAQARQALANALQPLSPSRKGPYRSALKKVTEHLYRNRTALNVMHTAQLLAYTLASEAQPPAPAPTPTPAFASPSRAQLAELAASHYYAPVQPGNLRPSLAAVARLVHPSPPNQELSSQAAAAWTHDLLMAHSPRYQRDFAGVERHVRIQGDHALDGIVDFAQSEGFDPLIAYEWTEQLARDNQTSAGPPTAQRHDTAIRWATNTASRVLGQRLADETISAALTSMNRGEQPRRTTNQFMIGVIEVNGLAGGDGMYPGATFDQMRTALRLATDALLTGNAPDDEVIARQVFPNSAFTQNTSPSPSNRVGGWLRGRGLLAGGVPLDGSLAKLYERLHALFAKTTLAKQPLNASAIAADLFTPLPLT
ncbi:hypothetical protein, partial [Streptomyces sp. NPDC058548]